VRQRATVMLINDTHRTPRLSGGGTGAGGPLQFDTTVVPAPNRPPKVGQYPGIDDRLQLTKQGVSRQWGPRPL